MVYLFSWKRIATSYARTAPGAKRQRDFTTRTAASSDYIVDGVSGLLVPPSDPEAMADAIARLDNDPALLATLAAGAAESARALTAEGWARALLQGSRLHDASHWAWNKWLLARARVDESGRSS